MGVSTAQAVHAPGAVLRPSAVDALIATLASEGYEVVGPTVRDGAIVLDQLQGSGDLPIGWTDAQEAGSYELARAGGAALFAYVVGPHTLRRFLAPPHRHLWSATRQDGLTTEAPPPPRRYAFIGVRACDLAALSVQDRVLRDGPFPDPDYATARDAAFIVAVNCARPAATCFCASMGTGPAVRHGYDLLLTELVDDGPHRLLVEAGTERGAEVLVAVAHTAATDEDIAAAEAVKEQAVRSMRKQMHPDARAVLASNLDHPRWDDVASRCLSCANCTLVCPTCFCTSTEDSTSLDGQRADRTQLWSSCFAIDHSYIHGGAIRPDIRSRYRQWLTHKLSTWWDQYGTSGCVGCGRCITWCPAAIDVTEEVAAIAGDVMSDKAGR